MRDKVNKGKKKDNPVHVPIVFTVSPCLINFSSVTLCNFVAKKNEQKGKLMRILRRQPDGKWKVARAIWTE
jgi:hypothetical protein